MKNYKKRYFIRAALVALFYFPTVPAFVFGQVPGIDEMNEATGMVKDDFHSLVPLVMTIGAITGLIGGIRVYSNWNSGKHHITPEVVGWFGACIFIQLVAALMSGLFGV